MARLTLSASRAAVLLMAARVSASVLTIVTLGFLSRAWDQSTYGEYRKIFLLFQVIGPFAALGIPAGLAFYLPQFSRRQQGALLREAAKAVSITAVIVSFLTFIGLACFQPCSPESLNQAFVIGLYPLFAIPALIVDVWLLAVKRVYLGVFFILFTATVQLLCVVVPVSFQFEFSVVLASLVFGNLARCMVAAFLFFKVYGWEKKPAENQYLNQLLRYSIPAGAATIFAGLLLNIDKVFISYWFSEAGYAVYSNGAIELPLIGVVTSSVASILGPILVSDYKNGNLQRMHYIWKTAMEKVSLLIFPLVGVVSFFAIDIVCILFSEKYIDSASVFRIYGLLLPLRITTHGSILLASGRSKEILISSIVGLLVAIVSVPLLTSCCGFVGAALGTVLAVYSVSAYLLFKTANCLRVRTYELFPIRYLFTVGWVTLVVSSITFLILQQISPGLLRLAIGMSIIGFSCLIVFMLIPNTRRVLINTIGSLIHAPIKALTKV